MSEPTIVVHPKPTDEELAVIIAVLQVRAARDESEVEEITTSESRWARAARREALREDLSPVRSSD